jgi:thiamine biosynthesis lipoprotein
VNARPRAPRRAIPARPLSAALAALAALACASEAPPPVTVRDARPLMGTLLQVTFVARDGGAARAAAEACFALGAELEAVLTTWDPASATSRMNASAGRGPFAAPAALARIIADSQRLSRATGGVFDPSVGPLIALWTQAGRSGRLPTADAIAAAKGRVGIERIRIGADGRVALEPGMAVDFGGVGKGWALDRMREQLAAHGVTNALFDFGGSSWLALGAPAEAPAWRVLLRDGRGGYAGTVTLRDRSASFSESFGESSEIAGRTFGHIVDPRTGWPIEAARAGFAVAPDGATAEALTKALLVLGPAEALALLAALPEAEALVIDEGGALHESSGFRRATHFAPLAAAGGSSP